MPRAGIMTRMRVRIARRSRGAGRNRSSRGMDETRRRRRLTRGGHGGCPASLSAIRTAGRRRGSARGGLDPRRATASRLTMVVIRIRTRPLAVPIGLVPSRSRRAAMKMLCRRRSGHGRAKLGTRARIRPGMRLRGMGATILNGDSCRWVGSRNRIAEGVQVGGVVVGVLGLALPSLRVPFLLPLSPRPLLRGRRVAGSRHDESGRDAGRRRLGLGRRRRWVRSAIA